MGKAPLSPQNSVALMNGDGSTTGTLIFRIGFWGPLYYTYNKEPPKQYR